MSFYGAYRAIVSNNKDPEQRGRITVQCPKVFGEYESPWCLPCSPLSLDGGGQVTIPSSGTVVMIMFEEGKEDNPIWLGCVWKPETTGLPAYDPDTYKQVIKTKKGHTILVDDSKDEIQITHSNGNKLSLSTEGASLTVSSGAGISISQEGEVTISGSKLDFNRV